jgi:hypothetical protein
MQPTNPRSKIMSEDGVLLRVRVNPLELLEADEAYATLLQRSATAESILEYLCAFDVPCDVPALIGRYREIGNESPALVAAPAEKQILDKLVSPLRHAKGSYMLGNYLGTISLCGMVSEMLAILLFDISEIYVNGAPMTEATQAALFGSRFERLGQERRVKILHGYGLIDDGVKASFDLVRTKRARYLHHWSQEHHTLAKDARECYHAAFGVFVFVLGQDVRDGMLIFRPQFVKYLQRQGLLAKPGEGANAPTS